MSVTIIQHNGVNIIYTDLSDKTISEAQEVLKDATKVIQNYHPKSLGSLLNVKGLRYNAPFLDEMKKTGKENEPYIFATAVFGLSAVTKLIGRGVVQFTGRKTEFFDSEQEAKDWLTKVR